MGGGHGAGEGSESERGGVRNRKEVPRYNQIERFPSGTLTSKWIPFRLSAQTHPFPLDIAVKRQYVYIFVEIVLVFPNRGHYDPIVKQKFCIASGIRAKQDGFDLILREQRRYATAQFLNDLFRFLICQHRVSFSL